MSERTGHPQQCFCRQQSRQSTSFENHLPPHLVQNALSIRAEGGSEMAGNHREVARHDWVLCCHPGEALNRNAKTGLDGPSFRTLRAGAVRPWVGHSASCGIFLFLISRAERASVTGEGFNMPASARWLIWDITEARHIADDTKRSTRRYAASRLLLSRPGCHGCHSKVVPP